tara:strand:+ start:896 stop:1396 length:501 start_codon:yes stop_codon:yes gene_type:complete
MQPFQKAWTLLKENYLLNEQFKHANSFLSPELMEEYYRNLVGREYEADNLNEANAAEQANHLREFVNPEEHGEAINQFEDAMRVHNDMEDQEHEVLYGDKYALPKLSLEEEYNRRYNEKEPKYPWDKGYDESRSMNREGQLHGDAVFGRVPIEQRLGVDSRGYPLD